MLETVAEAIYSPQGGGVRGDGESGRTEGQELEVLQELRSSGGGELVREVQRASVHARHGGKVMWVSGQNSQGSREDRRATRLVGRPVGDC